MAIIITYNKEEDILYISDKSKTVKYSFGLGDAFVVDFDERDRVVGLEVLDASEILFGITKQILESATNAKLHVNYSADLIVIGIAIKSAASQTPIYSSVPLSLVASH